MANKGVSGATLGAASAFVKPPTDAQVKTAVDAWLDDHPEATTTVQDGSITNAKLDASLQSTVADVSNLKTAVSDFYFESTDTGDYFVLDADDGESASASAEVTIGNKNMIISLPDLVVGQEYTSNQVTYVKAADGSIYFHGTASSNVNVNIAADITNLPAGKYTLSGCPTRGTGQTFTLYGSYWQGTSRKSWLTDTGSGDTWTLPADYTKALIYFNIPKDSSIDATVYPQLELAESATEYVQSANQTVSANTQFPITDNLVVFARNSVTLTVNKNGVEVLDARLTTAEADIDEIQEDVSGIESNITTMEGEIAENKNLVYGPYPTITPTTAQMVTFTDGANQVAIESLIVNLDYSSTARSKLRAFVSSENIFNLNDVVTKAHIIKNTDGSIVPDYAGSTTSIYTGLRGETTAVPSADFDVLPFLPAGTYYITGTTTGNLFVKTVNPSDGSVANVTVNSTTHAFTLASDSLINIMVSQSTTNIVLATAPQDSYKADTGKTYVVPFVDTDETAFMMYGGTVDLVNGIATELYDSSGDALETPVVHEITPVAVKSCLGYNHVWSDCTSVSVTYRADVKMYVDQRNKSNALEEYNIDASILGNVRNDLFVLQGANVISVAHRGLSQTYPENTLVAYKAAKTAGFFVAETDVDWTSDNVPVLLHDSTINRTARNADGTELSSTVSIRSITYEQALEYDFGVWKGEQFAGTEIPTFDQFIRLCRDVGINPFIELKYNQQTMEQTALLVQKVINHGMINRVSWISNFKDLLLQVLSIHQGANVQLVASQMTTDKWNAVSEIKSKYPAVNLTLCCGYDDLSSEDIATIKGLNIPLNVWTLDNTNTIKNLDPYISSVTSNSLIAANVLKEAAMA